MLPQDLFDSTTVYASLHESRNILPFAPKARYRILAPALTPCPYGMVSVGVFLKACVSVYTRYSVINIVSTSVPDDNPRATRGAGRKSVVDLAS